MELEEWIEIWVQWSKMLALDVEVEEDVLQAHVIELMGGWLSVEWLTHPVEVCGKRWRRCGSRLRT